MKILQKFLAVAILLVSMGLPAVAAKPSSAKSKASAIDASPMKTGVTRHARLVELKADQLDAAKKLFATIPAAVELGYQRAHCRNLSYYLRELAGKTYLFGYLEYEGTDWAKDAAGLARDPALRDWQASVDAISVTKASSALGQDELEEVFFTEGAAAVVPHPATYARTAMVTGLKREKEAEYRTLHATTWPAVLKGIKDTNIRNFSIFIVELDAKLYLIGYLEYVGKDPAADGAAGKAMAINQRWWKFTDACQEPSPAAAARKEIWDGMAEIYHRD